MNASPRIVAMTSGGPHAWIMINALMEHFGDLTVILEEEEPAHVFWERRKKLLGLTKVASMQAARLPLRLTKRGASARIAELTAAHGLKPEPDPALKLIRVPSVNTPEARDALVRLAPEAVFVVSTRMIGKATLRAVDAPFINYHSGINPAYRGMFGGYFALANGEPQHFGATVHFVDEGVDTGEVLYQSRATPGRRDTFHTYLWVIAASSREIVIRAMSDALAGTLVPKRIDLPSRQYFAPTLGGYIWTGLTRQVW